MDLGPGKRVLVTGGTKSIGRAIVDAFVAEGAVVGFCARDGKLVKQREADWRAKQARVTGTALDVTDDDGASSAGSTTQPPTAASIILSPMSAHSAPSTGRGLAARHRRRPGVDSERRFTFARISRRAVPARPLTIIGTVSLVEVAGPTAPLPLGQGRAGAFGEVARHRHGAQGGCAPTWYRRARSSRTATPGAASAMPVLERKRMLARNPSGRIRAHSPGSRCGDRVPGWRAGVREWHQLRRRRRLRQRGCSTERARPHDLGLAGLLVTAGIVGAFHVGKAPPSLPSIRDGLGERH